MRLNSKPRLALAIIAAVILIAEPSAQALPTGPAGRAIEPALTLAPTLVRAGGHRRGAAAGGRGRAVHGRRGGAAAGGGVHRGGVYHGGARRGGVYHGGAAWVRPSYGWAPGAAVAAGAALGFVTAATAAAWASAPPQPGLCWYYTDASKRTGFWDACPR
jgi:hypothetical protein